MNALKSKKADTFKSKIPVLIRKGKSSNLTCRENKIYEKLPLSAALNVNKNADESFHCLNKDLGKKSNHLVEKKTTVKTCKTDQINLRTSCINHTSNNFRTAPKSSSLKLKKGIKKCCQAVDASPIEGFRENDIKAEGLSVSENSKFVTASKNFQHIKTEHVKKTCSQLESAISDKSVKNSKCKFMSSKVNTQTTEKISINSEQNKNVMLLIHKNKSEKENQEIFDERCFSEQNNVQFEANELFRKMILSGRPPSPSICKITPGFRLSSLQAQRPSAYKKFEIHPNPVQQALEAIANMSAKRKSWVNRETLTQREKTILSPCQGRNSFYTPCDDPKKEVMKSLEALKAKRMQKSALKSSKGKKVTFNLNVEEYTARTDEWESKPVASKSYGEYTTKIRDCESEPVASKLLEECTAKIDDCESKLLAFKSSECRLAQINEGPEESIPRPKLCTPRPISFFPNSRSVNEYSSPEFLTEKALTSSLAPIYTPLALKSMARSPDAALSPVCLKLDFSTVGRCTPKNEISKICDSHYTNYTSRNTFRNISTTQKQLDDLADQECCSWLFNDCIPVVCERYLQNPVAAILTEGDEMHFLPIRL